MKSSTSFKSTDREGTLCLGKKHLNKQWQVTEYDNGCILFVPASIATDEEALEVFNKVLLKHQKTIDGLK